jgi:hypothetical protein
VNPKYFRNDFHGILFHVVQEASEVTKEAMKIAMYGLDSFNPELPIEQRETNRHALLREIDDLRHHLDRLYLATQNEKENT